MSIRKSLNFEYALIHANYWMAYGTITCFASAFLLGSSFSNSAIGLMLALSNIIALVMQPLTADIADRSHKVSLIEISLIMTYMIMAFSACLFFIKGKSIILLAIYMMMVTMHTVMQPLVNSLNAKLGECGAMLNFGVCRSVGSLAYAVLCAIIGSLIVMKGIMVLPIMNELILIALVFSLYSAAGKFNRLCAVNGVQKKEKNENQNIGLIKFARDNKLFLIMNLGIFLLYIHNQILNTFMLQIVSDVGGDAADTGRILSIMAFLEMPTLIGFKWLNRRFSCQTLIKAASIAFVAKITLIFFAQNVNMIYIAHLFQTFSYALFLPAMVKYVEEVMKDGEQIKGQALYTTMITAASIAGSIFGGFILDTQGAKFLTLLTAICAAVGAAIIISMVNKIKPYNNVDEYDSY